MALMFQSIFTFARIPMDAIAAGVDWLGGLGERNLIPPGDLNSLLVEGSDRGRRRRDRVPAADFLLFFFMGCLRIPATWRGRPF